MNATQWNTWTLASNLTRAADAQRSDLPVMKSKRINSTIPAATLTQRLASMSDSQLMFAARELASKADSDSLCTSVLEELESRVSTGAFDAFVAEIYAGR